MNDGSRRLIERWDNQRTNQRDITTNGLHRLAAEGVRHPGANRYRLFLGAGIPITNDEDNDLLTATRDLLIDDIEDGYLALSIIDGDECPDTHIALWRADQAHYEYFVPDDWAPLSAMEIATIETETHYRISRSGTYAHYCGPDRHFIASLSAESLMGWARRMLRSSTRTPCDLTRRLNVSAEVAGWQEAHSALTGVALGCVTSSRSPSRLSAATA